MRGTLLDIFESQVQRGPRRTALRHRVGQIWRTVSWGEWQEASRALAAALIDVGIQVADRVGIVSRTGMPWVEADLAIQMAGATTVAVYPDLLPETFGQIVRDCNIKLLFVEDPVQLSSILSSRAGQLPSDLIVILFERVVRHERPDESGRLDVQVEDVLNGRDVQVVLHEAFKAHGRELDCGDALQARRGRIHGASLAAIYFTSGTSGAPKGVGLTHDNCVAEVEALHRVVPVGRGDNQLLFLPLSHIMAKVTVMLQMKAGYVTSFAPSMQAAVEACAEVRPTFIVGVPRVYDKMADAITKYAERYEVQARGLEWALSVGRRVSEMRQQGREPGGFLAFQYRSAERLVFKRIKRRLGGRIRFMLSGAAPLSVATAEFFHALDMLILEGYGLTESTGVACLNLPEAYRFGSVGRPVPGIRVTLDDDGEILLEGPTVTGGYWGEDALREAWTSKGLFRTGDIGEIDDDGYVRITGRKKDLLITSGGKMLAPTPIEQQLETSKLIKAAFLVGDGRHFPAALIVPDMERLVFLGAELGLREDLTALVGQSAIRDRIAEDVVAVNETLPQYAKIKRFELMDHDFTSDPAMTSATGKVRRQQVLARYASLIAEMYEGSGRDVSDAL